MILRCLRKKRRRVRWKLGREIVLDQRSRDWLRLSHGNRETSALLLHGTLRANDCEFRLTLQHAGKAEQRHRQQCLERCQ